MNQRVFVLGEVNTPGVVAVTNGTMNLVEAIARTGDMTDYAERTNIKIIRGDLRKPMVRVAQHCRTQRKRRLPPVRRCPT